MPMALLIASTIDEDPNPNIGFASARVTGQRGNER
jgi:hypothetical protein